MIKYLLADSSAEDPYIEIDENCDLESDGEFVFDTLTEAKSRCLQRIDTEMKKLKQAKSYIIKLKL